MRPATPRARSRWRTNVVQPARECLGVLLGPPVRGRPAAARRWGSSYNWRVIRRGAQIDGPSLVTAIGQWGRELGFSQIGVAGVDLSDAEAGLLQWLSNGFHGAMAYMEAHGLKRARPADLVPGTLSVITARMDYL